MTDLVDHFKVQSLSEKGVALSDVSHDYWKLVLVPIKLVLENFIGVLMIRQPVKTAISSTLLGMISYLMMELPFPNKGYAYTPATLVSCSIEVSPKYGT